MKSQTLHLLTGLLITASSMANPAHGQATAAQQQTFELQRSRHMEAVIPRTQAEADAAWAEYDQLESAAARATSQAREQHAQQTEQSNTLPLPPKSAAGQRVYFGYAMLDDDNNCRQARTRINAIISPAPKQFSCTCLSTRSINDALVGRLRIVNECTGQFELDARQTPAALKANYGDNDWFLRLALTPLSPLAQALN